MYDLSALRFVMSEKKKKKKKKYGDNSVTEFACRRLMINLRKHIIYAPRAKFPFEFDGLIICRASMI